MDDKIDVAATLFLRPDETDAAFLSRIRHPGLRTTIPLLDRCLGSRQGTILEIVGPPGSGKSTLLYMVSFFLTSPQTSTSYLYIIIS